MTRNQKIVVFVLLTAISLLALGLIVHEMAAPRIARGIAGAPPVSAAGWLQLALAAVASLGFSAAGIWQAILAFIEARLPVVIPHSPAASPTPVTRVAAAVVDVTKLTGFLVLIRQVTDDATKVKLTEAARSYCDNLRDELFPFPEPK